ncbi:MAG: response regulator [Spirochaetota bacterium]
MRKKILIVEDDPQNMQLFCEILSMKGYETVSAFDGREGVDLALTCCPDLILMDIHLPCINGFDALAMIRDAQKESISVVAVTAVAGDERDFIARGFNGLIQKPVDIEEFCSRVDFYSTK